MPYRTKRYLTLATLLLACTATPLQAASSGWNLTNLAHFAIGVAMTRAQLGEKISLEASLPIPLPRCSKEVCPHGTITLYHGTKNISPPDVQSSLYCEAYLNRYDISSATMYMAIGHRFLMLEKQVGRPGRRWEELLATYYLVCRKVAEDQVSWLRVDGSIHGLVAGAQDGYTAVLAEMNARSSYRRNWRRRKHRKPRLAHPVYRRKPVCESHTTGATCPDDNSASAAIAQEEVGAAPPLPAPAIGTSMKSPTHESSSGSLVMVEPEGVTMMLALSEGSEAPEEDVFHPPTRYTGGHLADGEESSSSSISVWYSVSSNVGSENATM